MIKEIIDNIQFEFSGHTLVKMRYVGDHEVRDIDSVIIPSEIKGKPIYTIDKEILDVNEDSFSLNKIHIKKLVISEGITKISKGAFKFLNADKVVWASTCPKISQDCFEYADIKTISNIQDVEEIGNFAFYDCWALKNIIWPDNCHVVPAGCFSHCKSLKEFNFKAIKQVERAAFLESGLEKVLNLFKITTIEDSAFSNCYSLKEFTWPENSQVIPECCFQDSAIEKISNLKKVNKIEKNAFFNCPIKTLDLRDALRYHTGIDISDSAFNNINKITFLVS